MTGIPHVVILGGGFGGLSTAHELRNVLDPSKLRITLIDKKDWFMVGFAKLWIIRGTRTFENSIGNINNVLKKEINFVKEEVQEINFKSKLVKTDSKTLNYDFLVIALGAKLAPEKIDGLIDNGLMLYDHNHLDEIRQRLQSMKSGKIAISIIGMPYKCPPAPYEASLIINAMMQDAGVRDSIQIDIYSSTPSTLPAAGPQVSQEILERISEENIGFHGSCKVKSVRPNKLVFENNLEESFDLLLAIPPHVAPEIIHKSGLTQKEEFIKIDRNCKTIFDDVFAVGDITTLPVNEVQAVPKAGVFAEGEGLVVAKNIISKITEKEVKLLYDGKGSCFLESGKNTASLIEVDMFGQSKPVTNLTPSNEEHLTSKILFEKERLQKWF